MRGHSFPRALVGSAVIVAVLAGCAAQGGGVGNTAAPSSPTGAGGSPEAYTVDVHQDASLGGFLTGEDGKSLYVLTNDSSGTSTCTGGCASTWPPFTLDEGETVVAGAGVTGTLGTIKRPDGSDQVAINGMPFYYFSGDDGPAQTNGQGANGVWFLAAPGGGPLNGAVPSATGGGYDY
jgi:predicted lipoprotein with Yx(FWY)xxD motif